MIFIDVCDLRAPLWDSRKHNQISNKVSLIKEEIGLIFDQPLALQVILSNLLSRISFSSVCKSKVETEKNCAVFIPSIVMEILNSVNKENDGDFANQQPENAIDTSSQNSNMVNIPISSNNAVTFINLVQSRTMDADPNPFPQFLEILRSFRGTIHHKTINDSFANSQKYHFILY